MQSDLRDPLRSTGNIRVMTAVSQRALDYFNAQGDPEGLPDESRLLRALVLLALGEDQVNDGKLSAAAAKFDDAYRSSAAVLARKPRDPQAIFAHAQSAFWKGYVGWERNDRTVTTRFWSEYAKLAGALDAVEPGSVRSLMEQGYAAGNLCELDDRDGFDEAAALYHCAEAIAFETRARDRQVGIAGGAPTARRAAETARLRQIEEALSNRFGWMARVQMTIGDARSALASRGRETALLDGLLADDPTNVEHVLRRSWSDIGRAEAWLTLGQPGKVATMLRASLDRHELLLIRSGGGKRIDEALMREYLLLARALSETGRPHTVALARARHFRDRMASVGPPTERHAAAIWKTLWHSKEDTGK
jgi:hypothetical protein